MTDCEMSLGRTTERLTVRHWGGGLTGRCHAVVWVWVWVWERCEWVWVWVWVCGWVRVWVCVGVCLWGWECVWVRVGVWGWVCVGSRLEIPRCGAVEVRELCAWAVRVKGVRRMRSTRSRRGGRGCAGVGRRGVAQLVGWAQLVAQLVDGLGARDALPRRPTATIGSCHPCSGKDSVSVQLYGTLHMRCSSPVLSSTSEWL